MSSTQPQAAPSGRLISLDALRGFDMVWIIGGAAVFHSLHDVWPNPLTDAVAVQLSHVSWQGFHFYDLIFPLFMFIVGAVLPFSLLRRAERGESMRSLHLHVARRAAVLIVVGLVLRGLLNFDFVHMRFGGVLQLIGASYFFAALLALHTSTRTQAITTAALLLFYWAALALIPASLYRDGVLVHFGAGDYSLPGNLISFLDQKFLPGYLLYGPDCTDGAGPFLTITGTANVLIGVLAGHWLRSNRSGPRKVVGLAAAGLALLAVGGLWSIWLPIIKLIWSSSFVLYACGWSLLLLALFYGVVDVLGYRKWAFFFVVVGMNAITIYILHWIVDFNGIAKFFLNGVYRHAGGVAPLVLPLGSLAVEWLLLYFLYRRKIFIRI